MNNPWHYNLVPVTLENIPDGAMGFVYLITNLDTGRMYVGKKNLFRDKISVRTVTVKSGPNAGSKKKKKTRTPTHGDWPTYYGSSAALCEEIAAGDQNRYSRTILRWCYSKSEMSYWETYEQFTRHVLLTDLYYNSWITCKIHKAHVVNKLEPDPI